MNCVRSVVFSIGSLGLVLLTGCASMAPAPISDDGLELVSTKPLDSVYKKPGVDMQSYKSFIVADCTVAFKPGWQSDQNSAYRSTGRVTDKEMLKIKQTLGQMCTETFIEELKEGGYTIVDQPADGTLEIRPGIIDLYINAPDVMSVGRSTSYTTSEGSMRLNLEIYDSVTGEIVARASDKKSARDNGRMQWTNSVTNRVEAERILKRWAAVLRSMLDNVK